MTINYFVFVVIHVKQSSGLFFQYGRAKKYTFLGLEKV